MNPDRETFCWLTFLEVRLTEKLMLTEIPGVHRTQKVDLLNKTPRFSFYFRS